MEAHECSLDIKTIRSSWKYTKTSQAIVKEESIKFCKKEFYLLLMETCSINVLGGHNVPVLKCKFKDFLIEKNTDES